jgi:hypothetical protein
MDFVKSFKAARRVSTPLVAVRTADPASTIRTLAAAVQPTGAERVPVLYWDVIRGVDGFNKLGKEEASRIGANKENSGNPIGALNFAMKMGDNLPPDNRTGGPIMFMANTHLFWQNPPVIQAIWNLRDKFKERAVMLIMLTSDGAVLPTELVQDVLVLDEPLPTEAELEKIIEGTYQDFGAAKPAKAVVEKAVDALSGIAAFPAEQSLAMCLSKAGLDTNEVWERKRKVVEQTPGLTIWRGGETFKDIRGYERAKEWGRALLNAKQRIRAFIFMDEIEKMFAGTGTDLSGVKTEMTGTFLSWMQDKGYRGALFLGPGGSGKSLFGKSLGNEAGVPTIGLDFGGMQSSLVGASGERLRSALKKVDAVSQGSAVVIGTCNKLTSLPPELRRRFSLGTFMFDLPNEEERDAIWELYIEKFKLDSNQKRPRDTDWTGAEIFECCRKADDFGISLRDSGKYIVPIAVSAAEQISELRAFANGRFLSASEPGMYSYSAPVEKARPGRKVLEDVDTVQARIGSA